MTTKLLALIASYFACADIAEQRLLSIEEARRCGDLYHAVKLSFVPGVDADDFAGLSLEERIAVNRSGFLAFTEWRHKNPEMVLHLRAVARGEAELVNSG
jgi:hypothetical protein